MINSNLLISHCLNLHKTKIGVIKYTFIGGINWDKNGQDAHPRDWLQFHLYISRSLHPIYDTWEFTHPLLLSDTTTLDNNPNWHQVVNGPFLEQFYEAMGIAISTPENPGMWIKIKQSGGINVMKSTWAFKIKMLPNRLIYTFKARLCVHWDMQIKCVDYVDTFVHVVQWTTIRTLTILSVQLNLGTGHVDYTAAFLQAQLDNEVYVEIPQGLRDSGYV